VPIKNTIAGIQTTRLPVDIIATPHHKATGLFLFPARLENRFLGVPDKIVVILFNT